VPEVAPSPLVDQVGRWYRKRHPSARGVTVTVVDAPGGGYSNELLFVTVELDGERSDVVVRMAPAGPPLFPDYDLGMQVAVQAAAATAGIPVAQPIVLETDPAWLGRPFLLMPRVPGRHPGEAPAITPWVLALSFEQQRCLHTSLLDVLADIHTMPPTAVLRGGSLADELDWWERFATWACDGVGVSPEALLDLFAWCRAHLPGSEPPTSVLWGDVRLGNVVVGDDLRPAAILDWEMASLGPAESDLAWLTALTGMTDHFVGRGVPGFLERDEVIAHHEQRLGRPLHDMGWHEALALARAASVSVRTGIVQAMLAGTPPRDPTTHPAVRYARRFMSNLG
jgi:aminoglycoside phosphotransferase (APT) family kinase protein